MRKEAGEAKPKRIVVRVEDGEQKAVVAWLRLSSLVFFAVPNETRASFAALNWRHAMGVVPGAPDLVIASLAPINLRPTALEMKAPQGRVSKTQARMHAMLCEAGWNVAVGYGYRNATRKLDRLGYGPIPRGYVAVPHAVEVEPGLWVAPTALQKPTMVTTDDAGIGGSPGKGRQGAQGGAQGRVT